MEIRRYPLLMPYSRIRRVVRWQLILKRGPRVDYARNEHYRARYLAVARGEQL